ncbi:MAG: hypothetical protein JOY56_02815 [Solirubrobacterales bacterium]|nr:hypothetical protein [Solirubrobacterales bacterium]MBV8945136.1 hypothetical protein [Solirubrobacterales bacterium]MBV9364397.1 hypothetical protein [Solirubrobacterales bacterium]MBV9681276.1 hypothetical protein [Solirubrobacterales bacterium]
MLPTALVLADIPSSVGSGAVLTLVLPLGATLVAFVVWWVVLRRRGLLRAPRSPEHVESSASAPGPPPAQGAD